MTTVTVRIVGTPSRSKCSDPWALLALVDSSADRTGTQLGRDGIWSRQGCTVEIPEGKILRVVAGGTIKRATRMERVTGRVEVVADAGSEKPVLLSVGSPQSIDVEICGARVAGTIPAESASV